MTGALSYSLKSGSLISSALFLLRLLGSLGLLYFHISCKIFCSNSVKNAIGNLIGIALNLSEKAMAPHSSTHAWKIPWTEEPGRL